MFEPQRWTRKKKTLGVVPSEIGHHQRVMKSSRSTIKKAGETPSKRSLKSLPKFEEKHYIRITKNIPFASTNNLLNQVLRSRSKSLLRINESRNTNSFTSLVTPSSTLIVNHNKAALLIRSAIIDGGACTDPKRNLRLNIAIKRARDLGVPRATQQQIIRKCKLVSEGRPVSVLQIRYQRKVFIICTVHTRSLEEFQQRLMPILKKHFAGIAIVLPMFRSNTFIEAIVPSQICGDFQDLHHNVNTHAMACGAIRAHLQDYETGIFRFRVDPLIISDVARALKFKGYRITNTEYNFEPKKIVTLNQMEREAYDNFLWKIRQIPEIDSMFDNVKNSAAAKTS